MSREWKPGDVASMTWSLNRGGRFNVVRSDGRWRMLNWVEGSSDPDDDFLTDEWLEHMDGLSIRPLVVIDPEDREQVEALWMAWRDCAPEHLLAQDNLQAALRSIVADPKPEEPQGLGAVVEDDEGHVWVNADNSGLPWVSRFGGNLNQKAWRNINAVRVLSEGVQP